MEIEIYSVSATTEKEKDQKNNHDIFLFEKDHIRTYLRLPREKQDFTKKEIVEMIAYLKENLLNEDPEQTRLQEWLKEQWMDKSYTNTRPTMIQIPAWVNKVKNWNQGWIPILFIKQRHSEWDHSLIELLHSYLEFDFFEVTISETMLMIVISNLELKIPYHQSIELEEFAYGLQAMIQNEWEEEIKIGLHYPIDQIEDLIKEGRQLLLDEKWVMRLWQQVDLLLPWTHQLERLIFSIPEDGLKLFKPLQWPNDPELNKTLEVFFEENLNMSETARRLYIHRNTLQYRLEKIKQATNLDVKKFEDAVIAKIIMMLNKDDGQNTQN
ncbi:PucR family transcriptional regulator [Tepidibacillus infernus]|uniref:PucR family transcriptional regulator n=1 Tax=Tepidibacillus infernus TaxID=1806172 RepID=UPI003B6DD880